MKNLSKLDVIIAFLHMQQDVDPHKTIDACLDQAEQLVTLLGFEENDDSTVSTNESRSPLSAKEAGAFGVLLALHNQGELVSIAGFAEALEKSEPTAKTLLNTFVEKGYVQENKAGRKKIFVPLVAEVPEAPQ